MFLWPAALTQPRFPNRKRWMQSLWTPGLAVTLDIFCRSQRQQGPRRDVQRAEALVPMTWSVKCCQSATEERIARMRIGT